MFVVEDERLGINRWEKRWTVGALVEILVASVSL